MYRYYFEKMIVWQKARQLVNHIYDLTGNFPRDEDYHLKSQMRRSASSVKSNIAEGQGRKTKKDQAYFTSISYSSLIELLNHCITAFDQKLITENEYLKLRKEIDIIAGQLNALKRTQCNKLKNGIE